MSLNTVIIAIIVLVVLVVLVMIFTGYFGKVFTPAVQNCESAMSGRCSTAACAEGQTLAKYASVDNAAKAGCTITTAPGYCCKTQFAFPT